MAEQLPLLAKNQFLAALNDPEMTIPGGGSPLFDPVVVDIRLGGDESVNNPDTGLLTLPLTKIILAIQPDHLSENFFMGPDTNGNPVTLVMATIGFTVFSNTFAAQDEMEQRLLFARDRRAYIFSQYGMSLRSAGSRHPRNFVQPTGFYASDYTWSFFISRSTSDPNP